MTIAELIGESPAIRKLRDVMERLVRTAARGARPAAVLLQGETGTGKGMVAGLLHRMSARQGAPFVDVNCAAIPESLLEAELFGFERGAFTDARRAKPGLFQTAHRGTLFLDEVGLLPAAMQAKLLTVLEERAVRRLGGTQKEAADVWIVSASNADLATEVRARRFRADLYHRLALVTLRVPPLRERGDDVLLLAEHFLSRARADYGLPELTLGADARERLRVYSWPGNVRELANVIERAALLGDSARLTAATLGLRMREGESAETSRGSPPGFPPRSDVLRRNLQDALTTARGNITRTAEILGITRATVRAQMRRFGLRPDDGEPLDDPPDAVSPAPAPIEPAPPEMPPALWPATAPAPTALRWEYRRVAILRMGLPTGPTDAWSRGGRLLEVIVGKVQGFAGRIGSISPTFVEATFGVEPIEDVPRRAAHAALAILRAVERLRDHDREFPVPRLIIHTGRALIGRVAESVHIAHESRQALDEAILSLGDRCAPGEILVSAGAAAFLERRFSLAPVEDDGPSSVRAYGLISHERSGLGLWGRPGHFVGRDAELDRLHARAGHALAGHGQAVVLVGDAGVGKSRLIWEFTRRAERGWHLLETTCAGGGQALYHFATELVKAFFNLGPEEPATAIQSRIDAELASLDEGVRGAAPVLLSLLGVAADNERWEHLDPMARRRETLEALRALVVSASRLQPLLLVVEDLHWIDAESRAALDTIVSGLSAERILLLVSCRPGHEDRWESWEPCTRLRIDPLPADDATELLDALLGQEDGLAVLKERMIGWTEGNPFFLEETVRALVESGALEGTLGAYRVTGPVNRLEVPATVEEVLSARIDRLAPEDRSLLQTCATIGAVAPVAILRIVTACEEAALTAGLGRLQAGEFVSERSTAGGVEISFRHPLIHEVARLSLLPDARRDLHARVATAMEALYPSPAGELIDRLAHHAVAGEVWDKAAVYARQAGDRALRSFATHKAVEYFEHALGALRHLGEHGQAPLQELDLQLRLRDALWPLGRLTEMLACLREADELAARAGDCRRQGWIACYLAHYHWSVAENDQALAAGQRAHAIAEALDDPALAAETSFYVGITQLALGQSQQAVDTLRAALPQLDRAVETCESSFPSPRFALSGRPLLRSWLTRSLAELGHFREGLTLGEDALQVAEASHSPFGVIAAAAGLGHLRLRQGQPALAVPLLARALELCRTYAFHNWFPTVTANLGLAYIGLDRMAEGIALLEQSAEVSERTRIGATSALWRIYLAEAYLRGGRWSRAAEVARDALALARGRQERGHEARALWVLGEVQAGATPPDDAGAARTYTRALALAEEQGMRPLMLRCHLSLARLYGDAGQAGPAEVHRGRAASLAAELGMVLPEERRT